MSNELIAANKMQTDVIRTMSRTIGKAGMLIENIKTIGVDLDSGVIDLPDYHYKVTNSIKEFDANGARGNV